MIDVSQAFTALVVSAAVSVGISLKDQAVQERLLEDNIKATQNLSTSVDSLAIQLAVFQEKYATKKELEEKMKEMKDGS